MDIEEVAARLEITDVLHRYARSMDRMDAELALSCWHPGGTDDHAPLYKGSAAGFIEWLWPVHAAMEFTRHTISNILIELDGDRAGVECCYAVTLRVPHGDTVYDIMTLGRYVDRFEKLDGRWAIRHRTAVREWNRTEPVGMKAGDPRLPVLIAPHNPEATAQHVSRDTEDLSYRILFGRER